MALPVLVAAPFAAFAAIDWWTAVPWTGPGPDSSGLVFFRVKDAATGRYISGARFLKMEGETVVFDCVSPIPVLPLPIHTCGGSVRGTGYRSLVRDTRRANLRDTSLLVTAKGYEDYAVSASESPLLARPTLDGQEVEFVIRLQPEGE